MNTSTVRLWFRTAAWALLAIAVLSTSCKNHRNPDKTVSKFFVIRHAERYPGFEGELTWYGRLRAGDLMRLLKDSGINRIYVTPFLRTWQTADSLARLSKMDTVHYLADSTGADLIRALRSHKDFGRTILVIGHGNTVPALLRQLGVSYPARVLPDSVCNLMFEIVNDHGHVWMKQFTYGRPNLPLDSARPMMAQP